jgi:predicted secreted protein
VDYRRRTVSEDRRRVQGTEVQVFTVSLNGANIFIYADPESNVMGKRKTKEQQEKATLAEVIKEMARPRVAMSAREHCHIVRKEVLVVENNVQK